MPAMDEPMTSESVQAETHSVGRVDFSVAGIAGVRLLNASADDVAAVTRQLGPTRGRIQGEPDVVVHFVESLPRRSSLRYLGLHDSAFDDDRFFLIRPKRRALTRVSIDFDGIGDQCNIVCESGIGSVPLLIPILNLSILGKGILPLHAAAFRHEDKGVVVAGWAKGGKTETLLAFMANGAQYIGDEWVYIDDDGARGIPEPIKVWDWHLTDLPLYRSAIGPNGRARLSAFKSAHTIAEKLSGMTSRKGVERIAATLERQRYVHMPPAKLFGNDVCVRGGRVDIVLLAVSAASPAVSVVPIDPREIADRMAFSLQHEQLHLLADYLKFRFAFPQRQSALVEEAAETQKRLLHRVLEGKECYAVYHPFPASIPALFDALLPIVGRRLVARSES